MGEYFDSAYVAADGVILFYEDDDVSLQSVSLLHRAIPCCKREILA